MTKEGEHLLTENVNKTVRYSGFGLHSNPKAELYVCLEGSAVDHIDGVERFVNAGDVYILDVGSRHYQSDTQDFKCCIFQFDRDMLFERADAFRISSKTGFRELFESSNSLYVDADTLKRIERLADIMREETDFDIIDVMFLAVLSLVGSNCRERRYGEGNSGDKIYDVVRYIEQNFNERMTLDTLVEISNYSKRHITRLVQEWCGMSPMEYLDSVRIRNACALLVHTTLSVSQIAERCGFADYNLFSRHFRTVKGVSPTQFRRLNFEPEGKKSALSSINIIEK
ncbi:MAG: helix-turn-helix domain-containing protein [Clostridia bacterium]|nr:helix-turn-helix domain-containing protein [Clostridia bacterium]